MLSDILSFHFIVIVCFICVVNLLCLLDCIVLSFRLSIVSYSWNLSKSMRWPMPRHLTVRCRLNTNLCNKRDDINFLIVNFSFICNLCIWSGAYIIQNLCLLSWFAWWRVVANKKVTRSRVPSGYDEDITSEALRFPAWLG